MPLLVLLGRIFYSAIFILASWGHFTSEKIDYALSQGVPLAIVLVPLSGILALLGGLSILLGIKGRFGACLLALFLIPVTLMIHNFWSVSDPATATLQQIMFMKNLALLGAALFMIYFGTGPLSLDKIIKTRK